MCLLSVSRLAEVLREAVEDEQKVLHELALPETRFTVNQVHTYICTHAHTYILTNMYVQYLLTNMYVCTVCMYVHTYVQYLLTNMYVCMYVHTYVQYLLTNMYVCMYVHTYVQYLLSNMCVCMYVHIYVRTYVHCRSPPCPSLTMYVHVYMAMSYSTIILYGFTDWLWLIIKVTNRCVERLLSQRKGSLVTVNGMWIWYGS